MAYSEQQQWDRESFKRRGLGLGIALLVEAIVIIAILSLGMRSGAPDKNKRGLSTFSLEATSEAKSVSADKSDAETPVTKPPPRAVNPPIPKPLLPPVNPVRAPPPSPDFIKVSKSEYDAMDLSKLPASSTAGEGDAKAGAGAGAGSKGLMGPGLGPGGAQLYPVAWLREPYDSELRPYLAGIKRVPNGATADIACKMAEYNRVENCQIIGESPRGTGLAQALRKAAWQFLVKPPRIDNKPQLGVWVRIHFDFGVADVESDTAE